MLKMKILRTIKDLTQERLAQLVGVSQCHISRIERGLRRPSPDLKLRLAQVLGVDEEIFNSLGAQK